MFQRRHYEKVAATLRDLDPRESGELATHRVHQERYEFWLRTVRTFTVMFEANNTGFNRRGFLSLVGVSEALEAHMMGEGG